MPKKIVVLCFNKSEENEVQAFIRRINIREENKENDEIEAHIIYPTDVEDGKYMTWVNEEPDQKDKEILGSLTSSDHMYIWGHGSPNYAYIPGAFYTEIGNYLDKTLNKDQFSANNGPLKINVEICSGGRGGSLGENSFAAKLHSYLGKLGVYSEVSGRLRNVSVDLPSLPSEGLKTIPRQYDGLSRLVSISDSFYEHQAERSKVTFCWGGMDNKDQLRVDSYRRSLNREFLQLKDKLLEKIADSKILDPRIIHQLVLGIEFRLTDDTVSLVPDELKKLTQQLYEKSIEAGLDEHTLNKMGFERFNTVLERKASPDGFLRAYTGTRSDDPKLPIENKPLSEVLFDNPSMKKLNDVVEKLKLKNKMDNNPDVETLISSLGCEEAFGESGMYANFFMFYRKQAMVAENGQTTLPPSIEKIINQVVNVIGKVYLDDKLSLEEKNTEFKKYANRLGDYSENSKWGNIKATLRGALFGFKLAYNERHEASLLEVIPNLFYSAYQSSREEREWHETFREDLMGLNALIGSSLSPQGENLAKPNIKSIMNILRIPPNEREENIFAVFQLLDNPIMNNEDGNTPVIIEDIKNMIGELNHHKESDIANVLSEIRSKIASYNQEAPLNEQANKVLNAFMGESRLTFKTVRSNLLQEPEFNSILEESQQQLVKP